MEGIRKEKQEDQESEIIRKFYETRPGWSLLQVAKCPTLGCGKPLYCKAQGMSSMMDRHPRTSAIA